MAAWIAPESIPQFAAGTLMALLALWLLFLNPRSRVHLAFALFLVIRGGSNVVQALSRTPALQQTMFFQQPIWDIGVLTTALIFGLTYRNREAAGRTPSFVFWMLALAGIALEAGYLMAPTTYQRIVTDPVRGTGVRQEWFALVQPLRHACYAGVAFVLARDARRARDELRRTSLLLVSVGLALDAAFIATHWLLDLSFTPVGGEGFVRVIPMPWRIAQGAVYAAALALVVLAGMQWRRGARHSGGGRALAAVAVAVATGAGTSMLHLGPRIVHEYAVAIADGIWTLLVPLLAGYALVRYQLFDLDVKLRWTIKRGTLAGIFLGVFFVVTQTMQGFFQTQYNWLVGGIAAGILLFAVAPLQRFAERVANTAVPRTPSLATLPADARRRIYREQLRTAWKDGFVDRSERALLRNLREELGLSLEEADQLDHEVSQDDAGKSRRSGSGRGSL